MAKKCKFWCKLFKVAKVVVTIVAPPVGLAFAAADEVFHISEGLDAGGDTGNTPEPGGGLYGSARMQYLTPSQQVRSNKLNLM